MKHFDLCYFLKKVVQTVRSWHFWRERVRNVSIYVFFEEKCSKRFDLRVFHRFDFGSLRFFRVSTFFSNFLKQNPNSNYFLHWLWIWTSIDEINGEFWTIHISRVSFELLRIFFKIFLQFTVYSWFQTFDDDFEAKTRRFFMNIPGFVWRFERKILEEASASSGELRDRK